MKGEPDTASTASRRFLRGVNYHEMYPGAGMTLTREQVRRDLLDMKAMGSQLRAPGALLARRGRPTSWPTNSA